MAPKRKICPYLKQRRTEINDEIQTETIRQTASDFEKLTTEGLNISSKLIAEGSRSV